MIALRRHAGELPRARAARRGFTLVELVATMSILGFVAALSTSIVFRAVAACTDGATQSQLQTEATLALERITRELRNIELKPGAGAAAPNITSMTATSMTWNTDYALTLSGTDLMLADDGGASQVLLSNVSGFVVQAYDESNAALGASLSGTACDAVRRISVSISVQREGRTETVRTRVFVRSMMSGAG